MTNKTAFKKDHFTNHRIIIVWWFTIVILFFNTDLGACKKLWRYDPSYYDWEHKQEIARDEFYDSLLDNTIDDKLPFKTVCEDKKYSLCARPTSCKKLNKDKDANTNDTLQGKQQRRLAMLLRHMNCNN